MADWLDRPGAKLIIAVVTGAVLIAAGAVLRNQNQVGRSESSTRLVALKATVQSSVTALKITNDSSDDWRAIDISITSNRQTFSHHIDTIRAAMSETVPLMSFTTDEGLRFQPLQYAATSVRIEATQRGERAVGQYSFGR